MKEFFRTKNSRTLIAFSAAAFLLAPLFTSNAHANTVQAQETLVSVAQPVKRTLVELGAQSEPIRLTGDSAQYTFKLPVSPREIYSDGLFYFESVNSSALIRSRSEMVVRLNGKILTQYPLDPLQTRKREKVVLPGNLLKAGFNDLTVQVVQHYTYECQDSGSPELWTELDPQSSFVEFDVQGLRPNSKPRLSQLHIAYDSRMWSDRKTQIALGAERISEATMESIALVSQGISLRKGAGKNPDFEVLTANSSAAYTRQFGRFAGLNPELERKGDVVLVGTKAELSRLMDAQTAQAIDGPFIATFAGNEPESFVLVISGLTDKEVKHAARAFANQKFQHSDLSAEKVTADIAAFSPETSGYKVWTEFSNFGFTTTSSRGLYAQPFGFEFRTPGNFVGRRGDFVKLRLHFAYGAGHREESSLNLKLNGQFVSAIALNNVQGAEFTNYEVLLPANAIRPGFNELVFAPVFQANKGKCQGFNGDNLVVTVFEDSALSVPELTQSLEMPDLERFRSSLWPHDTGLQVYSLGAEPQTASTLASTMGLLSLKNKGPLDVSVHYDEPPTGHVLVLGSYGRLTDNLASILPLSNSYDWQASNSAAAWMQGQKEGRVFTALLSASPETAQKSIELALRKGLWNTLSGEATVFDTEQSVASVTPAKKRVEFSTKLNIASQVRDWKLLAVGAGLLALAFAFSFVRLLRAKAKNRDAAQKS